MYSENFTSAIIMTQKSFQLIASDNPEELFFSEDCEKLISFFEILLEWDMEQGKTQSK